MTDDSDGDSSEEYRPTDWLATHGTHYGLGVAEDQAIREVVARAGPWSDEWADGRDGVTVYVWKLHADSWSTIRMGAPERGADQLEYREYLIPVEEANALYAEVEGTDIALDTALAEADVVEEDQ
jgi:hypothetical protein